MNLRNPLFAPADQPRKIANAFASDADLVILDLEDSVAPAAKAAARQAAAEALRHCSGPRAAVRINALDTPWSLADLAAMVPAAPVAVMLPKCGGRADLHRLDHYLDALETAAGLPLGGIAVLALATESAAAARSLDYAGASARLSALCFGAEDLSSDLGIAPREKEGAYPAPIAAARAALLLAAAAAGVPALDTPWPDPRDATGLAGEAATAAADGFAGKLCIHPVQLAPVAAAFTPSPERLAWARAVRAAFAEHPAAGVLALGGRMIDRPHLRLAERLLGAVREG